jgi:hypothetical protein
VPRHSPPQKLTGRGRRGPHRRPDQLALSPGPRLQPGIRPGHDPGGRLFPTTRPPLLPDRQPAQLSRLGAGSPTVPAPRSRGPPPGREVVRVEIGRRRVRRRCRRSMARRQRPRRRARRRRHRCAMRSRSSGPAFRPGHG